jgi:prophage regulatory protein
MRLLIYPQLKSEKGIDYTREHLRRKVKAREFPAPIPLSDARIAWVEEEIDAWLEERKNQRDRRAVNYKASIAEEDTVGPKPRGRSRGRRARAQQSTSERKSTVAPAI